MCNKFFIFKQNTEHFMYMEIIFQMMIFPNFVFIQMIFCNFTVKGAKYNIFLYNCLNKEICWYLLFLMGIDKKTEWRLGVLRVQVSVYWKLC